MTKTTKVLSGAAKNAYFQRVVGSDAKFARETREQLAGRLQSEVTLVRVRAASLLSKPVPIAPTAAMPATDTSASAEPGIAKAGAPTAPFDPFSPNVVVLVRTQGAEGALSALQAIASVDNLRTLAREQQLSIDTGLAEPNDIRKAIIAAAERRIANRKAAAS